MDSKLVQVSLNAFGGYFMYRLHDVPRGIRGKTRAKADEVIIVGIPNKNMQEYCIKENLIITNKGVYLGDMDNMILSRKDDTYTYTE